MFKLKKEQQRLPIGGHQYPEQGLLVRGESFSEVVQKLTDYRLNNHIPIGDPIQDVLVHYAKNWPYMVEPDDSIKPRVEPDKYKMYRKWIEDTWRDPPKKILSNKEASFRMDACKTCPFNKKKDWINTKEATEVARRSFLLRRGADSPKEIGICSLHCCADLSVLSLVENPTHYSEKVKDAERPAHCWVK